MNILKFMQQLPDERILHCLSEGTEEQSGIVCKHCGRGNIAGISTNLFSSASTVITGSHYAPGTVMEHGKLPLRYWMAVCSC